MISNYKSASMIDKQSKKGARNYYSKVRGKLIEAIQRMENEKLDEIQDKINEITS